MAAKRKASPTRICIDGEISIYRATEIKTLLLASLSKHRSVELDLSQVTAFDTAGLQLMLFARRFTQARNQTLRVVAVSPAIAEVLQLLKLGSHRKANDSSATAG